MNTLQASQLSRDISTMQSTVALVLRHLGAEQAGVDGDQILYARWYCRRAIAQELGAGARAAFPQSARAPEDAKLLASCGAAATAEPADAWADQVEIYLRRKRGGIPAVTPLAAPLAAPLE